MQKFGKTLITNVGRQMLTEVDGAKGKITYTKAKLYTEQIGKMSEEQIVALTNLDGLQLETSLDVTNVEDTTVTVSASFNNAKVTKDLAFNSIGWFARTSVDDTEKLLAITPSEIEQTIVASDNGASTTSLDIEMVFARSHDTTVVVKPIEAGLVSSSQMAGAINKATNSIESNINKLSALIKPNSLFSNQKINLDTFTEIGITKFVNCQLETSGYMSGLNKNLTDLNGWIFNIPSLDYDQPYQQVIYINYSNNCPLTFIRSRTSGQVVENFKKILTENDAAKMIGIQKNSSENYFLEKDVNLDENIDTGIYRLDKCTLFSKADHENLGNDLSGWLINLNYDTAPSSPVYQFLIIKNKLFFRSIIPENEEYCKFDSFLYSSDISQMSNNINDLKNTINEDFHKSWIGTLEEYQNMKEHNSATIYYIVSDFEVKIK